MRAFPPKESLNYLIGLEVSHLTFHPYSLDLGFVDRTHLTAEYAVSLASKESPWENWDIQAGRHKPTSLHRPVDARVVDLSWRPFVLSLHFENGFVLNIESQEGPYESGHIWHNGEILVF